MQHTPEIPLITACATLAEHGVSIRYQTLWGMVVSGRIPSVRRGARVFLLIDPADLARTVRQELASRQKPPKAAA
jgi:hypothetical protein